MKFKWMMLAVFLVCLFAISAVSAADNATDNIVGVEETTDKVVSVEENQVIEQEDNDDAIGAKDDGTFTALQNKINNASSGSTIVLENDYIYDEGFDTQGISIRDKSLTIDGQGHSLNGLSKSRILIIHKGIYSDTITIKNIKFKNGYSIYNEELGERYDNGNGGAIHIGTYLDSGINLKLINCEFENNQAKNGGAIYGSCTSISNANPRESLTCIIDDCIFNNNYASDSGGAICDVDYNDKKWYILNSNFNDNHANDGGAIYSKIMSLKVENCHFNNNLVNGEGGALCIYDYAMLKDTSPLTFEYYGGINTTVSKCEFNSNNALKGGAIFWDAKDGCLVSSSFNYNAAGSEGDAVYWYGENGAISNFKSVTKGTKENNLYVYNNNAVVNGFNVTIVNSNKKETIITASNVNTVYNGGKYLIITVKDVYDKAVSGVKLTVKFSNVKTATSSATDKNGRVKVSTNGLAPKTYKATITFAGNNNYAKSTTTTKITVKKATPKLTANKKTFKKSVKTKKYTVTLKTNQNKVMKNTKVTIKVNKKTYTAKTNSKGVATFKITKLTKKGKYTATVTYKGSSYYNKLTKKVKITIK